MLTLLLVICVQAVAGNSTRVPLELQGTRAPILVVRIGGIPVRLRFDTGDPEQLVLQKAILSRVHATAIGKTARMQGIDGTFKTSFFRVAHVEIGGIPYNNVIATEDVARKGYAPDRDTGGWLGTGLLKAFQVIIDLPDHNMTLISEAAAVQSGLCTGAALPFVPDGPRWHDEPLTDISTGIGRVALWWDTGAFTSVLRKEMVKDSGRKTLTTRLHFGGQDFGPWAFKLWGNMNLPGFDGFIGDDFFSKHVVCVDFPARRVVVPRAANGHV
jgi:hypothetical protein